MKQALKVKLEMAKFLQQTLDNMSLKANGHHSESAKEFVEFFEKVKTIDYNSLNCTNPSLNNQLCAFKAYKLPIKAPINSFQNFTTLGWPFPETKS
jgi:hypothetical protein